MKRILFLLILIIGSLISYSQSNPSSIYKSTGTAQVHGEQSTNSFIKDSYQTGDIYIKVGDDGIIKIYDPLKIEDAVIIKPKSKPQYFPENNSTAGMVQIVPSSDIFFMTKYYNRDGTLNKILITNLGGKGTLYEHLTKMQ